MTAEVGVHGDVSAKVESQEEHGLDLANGTNETAHEDADGSYVFVSGKDATEDDPLQANLKCNGNAGDRGSDHVTEDRNAKLLVSESEEPRLDNGIMLQNGESSIPEDGAHNVLVEESHKHEIGVSDGGNQELQPELKSDLGLSLEENNESQIRVEKGDQINPDQDKDSIELTMDGPSRDHEEDFEQRSKMFSCPEADNGDDLPHHSTNDGASQTVIGSDLVGSNSAPETPETFPSNVPAQSVEHSTTVDDSDGRVDLTNQISLVGASENPVSDLGHNSEFAAEIQLQEEIVNASCPDENVEVLPDSHAQGRDPETMVVVDANHNIPEQGKASKILETPPSPFTHENANLDSPTNHEASSTITDTCAVDELRAEAEAGKSERNTTEILDSDPVDKFEKRNEVAENPPSSLVDEVRVEAEVGELEKNIVESVDSHSAGSLQVVINVATNTPASDVNVMSTELEDEKSEDNRIEGADSHHVDNLEAATVVEVENANVLSTELEDEKSEENRTEDANCHHVDNLEVATVAEVENAEESPGSQPIDHSEIETEVNENFQASAVDEVGAKAEILKSGEESTGSADSHPFDNSEAVIEVPDNEVRREAEVGKSEEKICASAVFHLVDNSEVNTSSVDGDTDTTPSCLASGGTSESKTEEVVASLPSTDVGTDPKVDIAAENFSPERSRDMPTNDGVATEHGKLNGTANGSEQNCNPDGCKVPNIANGGIQFFSIDNDKLSQESEAISVVCKNESPTCSPEGSTIETSEGQNLIPEGGKRRFYLVRVPRFEDENLKQQIRQAQLIVDERTKSRDSIRVEIQKKRATCKELSDNFESAVSQERAARELLRSKRQEIDSVQSVINIEDIDGRIRNMEHMIQHETLPMNEEKQLIREIKQLKQVRKNISSTLGKQDGVQQTLEQKVQIEERLKSLKKEADLLRDNVLKAEAITKAAKKKCSEENEELSKLLSDFKSADAIRQEAYAHFKSLRKESYEKNEHFRQYRDDAKAAYDLAFKRDIAALENLCASQVEKNMDILNKNDEYRKDYLRCNIRSTLRRLRTLDGRSLGPDEEPPVILHVINERVTKDSTLSISTPEGETSEPVVPAEAEKAKDTLVMKTAEEKNLAAKPKKSTKSAPPANVLAITSSRDEIDKVTEEEQKKIEEEEEMTRKKEELRKKEEELKLMEQRRLEEKAKAKEALERKKRIAEKAQARAVLRAQKEAEEKEKEREKKAKKKERRKAAAAGEETSVTNEVESAPTSETPTESETREKQVTTTKKPQKQSQYTKQAKAKSIPPPPPPLRNRGKRRMQPWMWVLLTLLVVFALFLVGNSNISFNSGLHRFNF